MLDESNQFKEGVRNNYFLAERGWGSTPPPCSQTSTKEVCVYLQESAKVVGGGAIVLRTYPQLVSVLYAYPYCVKRLNFHCSIVLPTVSTKLRIITSDEGINLNTIKYWFIYNIFDQNTSKFEYISSINIYIHGKFHSKLNYWILGQMIR